MVGDEGGDCWCCLFTSGDVDKWCSLVCGGGGSGFVFSTSSTRASRSSSLRDGGNCLTSETVSASGGKRRSAGETVSASDIDHRTLAVVLVLDLINCEIFVSFLLLYFVVLVSRVEFSV